jgi:hypothetical protein
MSTYEPIASQTLGSAAASVTFSSIPQGYTDLILVVSGSMSGTASSVYMDINGVTTGSTYSFTWLRGNGSAAASGRAANISLGAFLGSTAGYTTSQFNIICNIQNYANTTTYKSLTSRWNQADSEIDAIVNLWRSTNAITSLRIKNNGSDNFTTGSTFSIYGIQVGNAAAKAQGGNIVVSDGTYMYHTFTSSGSFIPNEALTADALVVAGGGGGGWNLSGGGGAGGYLTFTSQSLTAKSYPVIVGAGGSGSTIAGTSYNGNDSQFGSLTLVKGGGGGRGFQAYTGLSGGSGGGGGTNNAGAGGAGGSASPSGQGNNGGAGSGGGIDGGGGGGGGAGAVGADGTSPNGGAGGIGSFTAISGGATTGQGQLSGGNYYFAGGGSGGTQRTATSTAGGIGGGGAGGSSSTTTGVAGTANTGGGGGGSGNSGLGTNSGGSGIVIIRYAL